MSPRKKPSRWRRLWTRLRGGELSPKRASASVAVGLFVGSLPLYGLHLPLCLLVCVPLRLDAVTAYLAANVSNPLFAPFLVTAEVEVGALVTSGGFVEFTVEQARALGVGGFVLQLAVGSVVVGAALALVGGVVTRRLVREPTAESRALRGAVERTVQRYADAPRAHRFYVALKLESDPLTGRLAKLADLGEVADAACGRGQFALLLFELGAAKRVVGFDWDATKIEVATAAAEGDIELSVADLRNVELPEVDTLLLLDALHYLGVEEQDLVLERAVASVRPGGRVLIRELDGATRGGRLALLFERMAVRARLNSGERITARPIADIVARLAKAGFAVRVQSAGGLLGNRLVVAERPAQLESSATSASSTSASVSSAGATMEATVGAAPVSA
ncbi:MAG: DUF2062 domain-containing protein [Myxococcales bacterium]|nr:DUF2062 domain-containing protein [Myxococcales bacterium]MCB9581841.1 DUF2062 domain-containing protein [Polyangiaceae bacterium]